MFMLPLVFMEKEVPVIQGIPIVHVENEALIEAPGFKQENFHNMSKFS